ncbi:hypothetical protein DICVIV_10575 [Dictyocaulus viviparus]|uniref:7TM GPCR serpentine receptor class x (Srx) domain-containing protein n=1 Tax=Dictyocaulus viviparus TaxID=29172 RepID=A0A0D8XFN2_DICVI|nr:hypothetical protein DICVIV_10575 [Dictyocaulus viviparus]
MLVFYIIIHIKIRKSKQNTGNAFKNEKAFLIQTIPLSVLFAIEMISFKIIPNLEIAGHYRFFVSTFGNQLILMIDVATPALLLIFNKDIRKFVKFSPQRSRW